jgi:hypothetical protein
MGYELDGRSLIIGREKGFSLLYSVQTGSGAHERLLSNGYWDSFPGGKSDHSPPSSAEVKNGGAIPTFPLRLHGIMLNYLSTITHRKNFLFFLISTVLLRG